MSLMTLVFFPPLLYLSHSFLLLDYRRLLMEKEILNFCFFVPPTGSWALRSHVSLLKATLCHLQLHHSAPICHPSPSTSLHWLHLSPSRPQATLSPCLYLPSISFTCGARDKPHPHPPFPEYQSEFGVCREKPESGAMSFFLERLSRSSWA